MQTFILILTLWSNDMSGHAYMHSIQFSGLERCQSAATAWEQSITKTGERRSAVCVAYNKPSKIF